MSNYQMTAIEIGQLIWKNTETHNRRMTVFVSAWFRAVIITICKSENQMDKLKAVYSYLQYKCQERKHHG